MGDREVKVVTQTIYSETFSVNYGDEKCQGKVRYNVSVSYHAYETGETTFIGGDTRACHFDPSPRMLYRDVIIVHNNGQEEVKASKIITLPLPPGKYFGNDCNRSIGELGQYVTEQVGSLDTWQSYIDADKAEVDAALGVLGQVTNRHPVQQ